MKPLLLVLFFAGAIAGAQTQSGASAHSTRKADEQVLQQETFSPSVADVLVARIGEGLAGHNRKTLLSAFGKNDSQDFAAIKEQVNAIMEAYRAFRVHYTVQSSAANPDGTATLHATFEIEQQPASDNTLPFRRNAELTLTATRTKSGWRVVSFSPVNFFIASQ